VCRNRISAEAEVLNDFMLDLLFDPEDGNLFLLNFKLSPNCVDFYPRRPCISAGKLFFMYHYFHRITW
jgi:hypothetical protein